MSDLKPDRRALLVSVVTGLLLGTCVFLAAKITNSPPLDRLDVEFWELLGTPMPAFAQETLTGETLSDQTWAGKDHVLVFGESGCHACDEIYPKLQEISVTVPVGLIATGNRVDLAAKVVEQGFRFPVAFDSLAGVARSLEVRGYPTAVWVDGQGQIVKAASGTFYAVQVLQQAQVAFAEEE